MAVRCPKCNAKGFQAGDFACEQCGWTYPQLAEFVPSGWYDDPAADGPGKMRYWNVVTGWQGKSQDSTKPRPVPAEPPAQRLDLGPPPWDGIVITTSHELPGRTITEHCGEVVGLTVRSRNTFSDLGASLKSVVGGEVGGYTKMFRSARDEALDRLRQEAYAIDADAVISMRMGGASVSDGMTELLAYGAAVKTAPAGAGTAHPG